MMTGFRSYNTILIATVLLLGSILSISSLSTQPYDGDLTRIGGYSEKLYGWNTPQPTFEKSLFKYAKKWESYDRAYDVVVIGDSFSQDKLRGWQNFLVNNTGLSVITFHVERSKLSDLLNHPQFIKTPPLAVVYESVERMIMPRLARENKLPSIQTNSLQSQFPSVPLKPEQIKTQNIPRPTHASFINKLNVTSDLASKGFIRDILGLHLFKSTTLDLKQTLFSSEKGNQLLFLKNHLSKNSLSLGMMNKAVQGAEKIKNRVEQNGVTRFYLLVFPNKISVYREQLSDNKLDIVSFYDFRDKFASFGLVPLYDPLFQAVEDKRIDVYFSDDTHTSAIGYKMAAETLQQKMLEDGLFQPSSLAQDSM